MPPSLPRPAPVDNLQERELARANEARANANALISARILRRVREGADVCAAFDEVIGEGAFAQLASDLYDRLRARA